MYCGSIKISNLNPKDVHLNQKTIKSIVTHTNTKRTFRSKTQMQQKIILYDLNQDRNHGFFNSPEASLQRRMERKFRLIHCNVADGMDNSMIQAMQVTHCSG